MACPDTDEPAPALYGEPALNKSEQLGGPLNSQDSPTLTELQASRLSRLYALSFSTASTVASLAFAVSR